MNLLESTLLLSSRDLSLSTLGSRLLVLSLSLSLLDLGGLLSLLQPLLSGSLSLSWLLVSLLLDLFQRSTDDRSLVLDGSSGSLLRGLLRDTLLVLLSEQDGPSDSSWVLSLVEQGGRLGGLESENLGVSSDKQGTSAWVNLSAGKGIELDLHCAIC